MKVTNAFSGNEGNIKINKNDYFINMESHSSDAFRLNLPYIATIASARDTAEEVHEPLIP